jgi:hypothetical protein
MIKKYICEKIELVTIYCKVQIYFLNDSKIAKLDEIFNFILNMSSLYHFNYN